MSEIEENDEYGEFMDVFDMFDSNRDGKVSVKDLDLIFRALGQSVTKQERNLIMKITCTDQKETLGFPEFLKLINKWHAWLKERIQEQEYDHEYELKMGNSLRKTDEYNEAVDIFKKLDTHNDGRIICNNISSGVQSMMPDLTNDKTDVIRNLIEMNEGGSIQFAEVFGALDKIETGQCKNKDELIEEGDVRALFRTLDVQGNGMVSSDDIRRMGSAFGENLSEEVAELAISELDVNEDNQINYEEYMIFIKFMKSSNESQSALNW